MITENEIRNAVDVLRKNSLKARVCLRCKEEFYVHDGNDWDDSDRYYECDCGGELIRQKK